MNREEIISDLTPFADIGDNAIKVAEQPKQFTIRLTREGRQLKLSIDKETGKIQANWGTAPRNFSGFPAMLASEIFSNLKKWSDAQRELLRREVPSAENLLPIHGRTHDGEVIESASQIDDKIGVAPRTADATEILLIDGPAGIGKTNLIEQLSLGRAEAYRTSAKPLILHVKSRGRVLSNLQDLMAFSLQTIRSQITYDQIPILAKHGLVVIAIDGFDELADPNGYEMAWAQLSDLVIFVRGRGTLILAGRDTFIGRTRLLKDVEALRDGIDVVTGLTLGPPTPAQAKKWLLRHHWTQASFSLAPISVLLEEGSFALRPVFLKILAEHVKPRELKDKHERYLTPLLVNYMIEREASLFGKAVESVMNKVEREAFVLDFLCEVARQMADSQTESLDSSDIAWISEAALGDNRPAEVVSLIKNRASIVAFFVNDERPGYKSFMHSYLLNYFLAIVSINAISQRDIPKYVRRNLLGSEFLSVFSDVAAEASISSPDKFSSFWANASTLSLSYVSADRGLRNVGALVMAALPAATSQEFPTLREFQIDDAVIRGACPPTSAIKIEINQLDGMGADLSAISWANSTIGAFLVDNAVRVSTSFPIPIKISLQSGEQISKPEEVLMWLGRHGLDPQVTVTDGIVPAALKGKPIYKLLVRAARMRQYWLRADSEDIQASRVINDPQWDALCEILSRHDYLREEIRAASGRASRFYHIKHRESILAESATDENLKRLIEDLKTA